jgi:hypothetical protein
MSRWLERARDQDTTRRGVEVAENIVDLVFDTIA